MPQTLLTWVKRHEVDNGMREGDLFRSIMGDGFKKIKEGVYPGDGVLDPRWTDTQRFVKKTGRWKTDFADVSNGGCRPLAVGRG